MLVQEGRDELEKLYRTEVVKFKRVPEYRGVEGYVRVDELAKHGSSTLPSGPKRLTLIFKRSWLCSIYFTFQLTPQSKGDNSGDWGSHSMLPLMPIQCRLNVGLHTDEHVKYIAEEYRPVKKSNNLHHVIDHFQLYKSRQDQSRLPVIVNTFLQSHYQVKKRSNLSITSPHIWFMLIHDSVYAPREKF